MVLAKDPRWKIKGKEQYALVETRLWDKDKKEGELYKFRQNHPFYKDMRGSSFILMVLDHGLYRMLDNAVLSYDTVMGIHERIESGILKIKTARKDLMKDIQDRGLNTWEQRQFNLILEEGLIWLKEHDLRNKAEKTREEIEDRMVFWLRQDPDVKGAIGEAVSEVISEAIQDTHPGWSVKPVR